MDRGILNLADCDNVWVVARFLDKTMAVKALLSTPNCKSMTLPAEDRHVTTFHARKAVIFADQILTSDVNWKKSRKPSDACYIFNRRFSHAIKPACWLHVIDAIIIARC